MNRLGSYKVIILSVHTSGMGNTVASLSGFETILNNNESNNIYFSASALIFFDCCFITGQLILS